MEESDKLPLKRVELSLSKFNEVAIPHHLDLLRQHKANIIKYTGAGEHAAAAREQAAARRAAARLRALLDELDALRGRVRTADLPAFHLRTRRARDDTHAAVMDYLEWSSGGASAVGACGSVESTESVGLVQEWGDAQGELLQLQVDEDISLEAREAALRGWAALHTEVRALHEAWQHVQAAALQQRAPVQHVADCTEAASVHVESARGHLAGAARLSGGWAAAGALGGALCGGPVGLVVGVKAGAAAALAGSLLGGLAARLLRNRATRPNSDRKDE